MRNWLGTNLPMSGLRGGDNRAHADKSTLEKMKEWHRRLYEAGYLALAWPKEYGGQTMDAVRQTIVNKEMVRARAPGPVGDGIPLLGPRLITWGSENQKRRYLPKILSAEEIWCQGYSEPGSGSDLASLRTRAETLAMNISSMARRFGPPGRGLLSYAAHLLDTRPGEASRAAAMVKARMREVFIRSAHRAVLMHSGIGFTWDHDIQLWFKRARFNEAYFGAPPFHRERVAVLGDY